MGRSSPPYLAVAALVGLSGCLLFTAPINEEPKVTIQGPSSIQRGKTTTDGWKATLTDEDSPRDVEWAVLANVNQGCTSIAKTDWPSPTEPPPRNPTLLDRDRPFELTWQKVEVVCVCARAVDSHGAVGMACQPVSVVNAKPIAEVTDVEAWSKPTRPLCREIHLSAATSTFPTDEADDVEFNWTLDYSGGDPNGRNLQLVSCSGIPAGVEAQHRCLRPTVAGTYTVTLSITDTPLSGGGGPLTSDPVQFVAKVDPDAPPCLLRTDPEYNAQQILMSVGYETRVFEVSSVKDDCEPYPGDPDKQSRFKWSLWDGSQWSYPATGASFLQVSRATFPNPRLGDEVKVRVEVRDTPVENLYRTPGYSACPPDTDLCCEGGLCAGENGCVRWTTWTVLFEP